MALTDMQASRLGGFDRPLSAEESLMAGDSEQYGCLSKIFHGQKKSAKAGVGIQRQSYTQIGVTLFWELPRRYASSKIGVLLVALGARKRSSPQDKDSGRQSRSATRSYCSRPNNKRCR